MIHPEDALLDRATLERLTGTKQPARMVRWLEARGWVFEQPAGRGKLPAVAVAYYRARLTGQPIAQRRDGPRLDFMLNPAACSSTSTTR